MQSRLQLPIRPDNPELATHVVPLQATLHYAPIAPLVVEVTGGARATVPIIVPGPLPLTDLNIIPQITHDGLRVEGPGVPMPVRADDSGRAHLELHLAADDCCTTGEYAGRVELDAPDSHLVVPLTVRVRDPGFW